MSHDWRGLHPRRLPPGVVYTQGRGLHLRSLPTGGQTPSRDTWDMVNKRAVRILLECFLVFSDRHKFDQN